MIYKAQNVCKVSKKKKRERERERERKRGNNFINFHTNYRRRIKFMLINMDFCLLEFDALNFFLGDRLHGVFLPNFNFFSAKQPI